MEAHVPGTFLEAARVISDITAGIKSDLAAIALDGAAEVAEPNFIPPHGVDVLDKSPMQQDGGNA